MESEFTEADLVPNISFDQLRLIDKCIQQGYGYAQFARSVQQSGRCSKRQEETMLQMLADIDRRQRDFASEWRAKSRKRRPVECLTNSEIMTANEDRGEWF